MRGRPKATGKKRGRKTDNGRENDWRIEKNIPIFRRSNAGAEIKYPDIYNALVDMDINDCMTYNIDKYGDIIPSVRKRVGDLHPDKHYVMSRLDGRIWRVEHGRRANKMKGRRRTMDK